MNFLNKIFCSLLFFAITTFSYSQTNGSFENWTTYGTYEDPDNWQTLNFLKNFGNPISVFKVGGTDKYAGNYALKIKTVFLNNKIISSLPDTLGIVFNGKILVSPPSYKIGSPYTIRSEKLRLYAKYNAVGNDSGLVFVSLQKNTPTGRDTIASGQISVPPNGSYSFFEIPLNYRSNGVPDTASIVFGSSKNPTYARVGSELFIDEVSFDGVVIIGIKENQNPYQLKIKTYPNPASNEINIDIPFDEANKVEVLDITGKSIDNYKIQNYKATINTSLFVNGNYTYTIYDKKNKLLTSGKFIIIK